jgi:hypothetical protein
MNNSIEANPRMENKGTHLEIQFSNGALTKVERDATGAIKITEFSALSEKLKTFIFPAPAKGVKRE